MIWLRQLVSYVLVGHKRFSVGLSTSALGFILFGGGKKSLSAFR